MDPEEVRSLESSLPDDHSRLLLTGSVRVAEDIENPIRMHLYAAGMRELFGHILRLFAPDDSVRACEWFVQAQDTPTVTRRQRAVYATQGGLTDEFIAGIGFDVVPLHRAALDAVNVLNAATHVQHGQIERDQNEIVRFANRILLALRELLDCFRECRRRVAASLEDDVYPAITREFVERTFDEIDLLSSHGSELDTVTIDECSVEEIDANAIHLSVSGEVSMTLLYGRGDDTTEIPHTFPFSMRFVAPVDDPQDLSMTEYEIDDSDWFGQGDAED